MDVANKQRDNLLQTKTLELQRSGNCEDEEETSKTIHCPFCGITIFASTTFRGRGAKQTNLSKEEEEQAQHPLRECSKHNKARAKLKSKRRNSTDTANGCSKYGKANDHHHKRPLQNVSKLETQQDEKVQLNCGKMARAP